MSLTKCYIIFILAVIIQASGIALVVKSLLGTSPISSLPYVLSLISPYTLGQTTFVVNMVMLVLQIAILRRRFRRYQLMQVPVTIVFAYAIDVFMALFSWVEPEAYAFKMLTLLIGATFVSLGVALQGIANVLMLAGEALVYAICRVFHIDLAKVKTSLDVTLVLIAVALALPTLGTIEGVREGTLISALITGVIARFFIRHLSRVDEKGRLVFSIHF